MLREDVRRAETWQYLRDFSPKFTISMHEDIKDCNSPVNPLFITRLSFDNAPGRLSSHMKFVLR